MGRQLPVLTPSPTPAALNGTQIVYGIRRVGLQTWTTFHLNNLLRVLRTKQHKVRGLEGTWRLISRGLGMGCSHPWPPGALGLHPPQLLILVGRRTSGSPRWVFGCLVGCAKFQAEVARFLG